MVVSDCHTIQVFSKKHNPYFATVVDHTGPLQIGTDFVIYTLPHARGSYPCLLWRVHDLNPLYDAAVESLAHGKAATGSVFRVTNFKWAIFNPPTLVHLMVRVTNQSRWLLCKGVSSLSLAYLAYLVAQCPCAPLLECHKESALILFGLSFGAIFFSGRA